MKKILSFVHKFTKAILMVLTNLGANVLAGFCLQTQKHKQNSTF